MRSPLVGRERPIAAVVFDFGGVLTHPLRDAVLPQVLAAGFDPAVVVDVFRPMFASADDGDAPWHKLERGDVTMAEFLQQLDPSPRAVAQALFDPASPNFALGHIRPHDAMLGFAREARDAGYRTAILSNDAREWRPAWDTVLRDADHFDHVVRSSEIGVRKPDARSYAHVLGLLGVEAEASLFIDDFEPMVDGARRVGMRAIHLVDHDAAIVEARAALALDV